MEVLCTPTKVRTKLKGRWTLHRRLFGALQSTVLQLKIFSACQGYCHMLDGAILFSKIVRSQYWCLFSRLLSRASGFCMKIPVADPDESKLDKDSDMRN